MINHSLLAHLATRSLLSITMMSAIIRCHGWMGPCSIFLLCAGLFNIRHNLCWWKVMGFLSFYSFIIFHEVSTPHFLHPINRQLHWLKKRKKAETTNRKKKPTKFGLCLEKSLSYILVTIKLFKVCISLCSCKFLQASEFLKHAYTDAKTSVFNHIRPLSLNTFKKFIIFFFWSSRF